MLTRAELIITASKSAVVTKIPLHFNPKKIDVSRGLKIERAPNVGGNAKSGRVASIDPISFKLDALLFDTYESRKSVRSEVIDKLEDALCKGSMEEGEYSLVRFNWGSFTSSRHDSEYQFLLRGFDCSYELFLPDGTPVRARVNLRMEQYNTTKPQEKANAKASTEAQVHKVRRGETAQSMAAKLLGDPTQWRKICLANKISDPANIPPGTQLIIPPARLSA